MKLRTLLSLAVLAAPLPLQALADTQTTTVTACDALWQDNKLTEAESCFRDAAAAEAVSPTPYARLGALLLTLNRNEEAIDNYQEAIQRAPEQPELFLGIAIAYLHQSQFSRAHAMVGQALALNPDLEQAQKLSEYLAKKQESLDQAADQAPGESAVPQTHP